MAYDLGEMHASVTLDDSPFNRKLDRLGAKGEKTFNGIGSSVNGLGGAMQGMGGAISSAAGAIGIAVGAATALLLVLKKAFDKTKEFINLFTIQEDAERSLLTALRYTDTAISKNRKSAEDYAKQIFSTKSRIDAMAKTKYDLNLSKQYEGLKEYASEIQKATVYGDEFTLRQMAMGMNMGISSKQIKEATKAAIGLSESYSNLSFESAMQLVARANKGQTSMLTRYGIVLDDSMGKQEKFNALLKMGADRFVLAEEKAKTLGGRLKQQGAAWGDLKERIGEFIADLFCIKDLSETLTDLIAKASDYIKKNAPYWVHEIHRVYIEAEATVKKAWALIEPVATFVYEVFKAAATNIVNVTKWCFDNSVLIWINLGKVVDAVFEDFRQGFIAGIDFIVTFVKAQIEYNVTIFNSAIKNMEGLIFDFFEIIKRTIHSIIQYVLEACVQITKIWESIGKNFWDLITGKKTFTEAMGNILGDYKTAFKEIGESVSKEWKGFDFNKGTKQFAQDIMGAEAKRAETIINKGAEALAKAGINTERAMKQIGTTPFPELQGPNYGAVIDKYKNLGKAFSEIDKERDRKLKENDRWLKNKLNRKVDGGKNKGVAEEEQKRQTPIGSFSVALLAAMGGAQSPAQRTARATEKMQKDINSIRRGGKTLTFG